MENGKLSEPSGVPPRMNEALQQAGEYMRVLQDRFDSSVWKPGKQRSQEFGQAYPITGTFVAIFAALALVPVVSYLIFVTFILISCTSVALALAIGATLFVGFWAGVFLFFTLLLILGFTVLATSVLLGFYLCYRLVFHVRSEDGQGVRGWAYETKDRLVPPTIQAYATQAQKQAGDYASQAQKQAGNYYTAAKEQSVKKTDQM